VANRQPWDDDLKAQAKALYLADGAALASSVTGIPARTIRAWSKRGNWRQPDAATGQDPDQALAPHATDGAGERPNAKEDGGPFGPPGPLPGPVDLRRELARDLHLARQVYRAEVERFLAGTGRASSVRDAAVALAVMTDKMGKHGGAGAGGGGGEFTWADHLADNEARRQRVLSMLGELLPVWRERAQAAGNGQGHG
jgi:hypothetical protein